MPAHRRRARRTLDARRLHGSSVVADRGGFGGGDWPRRQWLRIRDSLSVRIRDRFEGEETVTCVIPGHDREGEELIADQLLVEDAPLAFRYSGVCGYGSTFDYAG